MVDIHFIQPSDNFFYKKDNILYFSKLYPLETYYKSNKKTFRKEMLPEIYHNNTKKWSSNEQKMVTNHINRVIEIFEQNQFTNINKLPWKLIKLSSDLEWGYPFTLQDTILIPDNEIEFAKMENNTAFNDTAFNDALIETLIHEIIHIYQKANPDIVNKFYTKQWNWIKSNHITIPHDYKSRFVHNPDGMDNTSWIWLCPNSKEYIFQSLYLKPIIKDQQLNDKIIEMRWILTSEDQLSGKTTFTLQQNVKHVVCLENNVGGNNHMYHPHEMMAYLGTKHLINKLELKKGYRYYVQVLLNFMKNNL